jgi:hypothetical protein
VVFRFQLNLFLGHLLPSLRTQLSAGLMQGLKARIKGGDLACDMFDGFVPVIKTLVDKGTDYDSCGAICHEVLFSVCCCCVFFQLNGSCFFFFFFSSSSSSSSSSSFFFFFFFFFFFL